jgi:hypothetical protein
MQPVKIVDSQTDWYNEEAWSLDALQDIIGHRSVYRAAKHCKCAAAACVQLLHDWPLLTLLSQGSTQ